MLEIRVLGDVKVVRDGESPPVPHGLVRSVLLALVANLDRVVSDQTLADRLWGEVAPRTAAYSLRNSVSRLRDLVGEHVVVRAAGGYRLVASTARVDLVEFEQHLTRARTLVEVDPAAAVVGLDEALGMVRGLPYAEVRDEEWALATARSADDLVAAAEEVWTDARIRCGDVGPDLWRIRAYAAAQPMREGRWCRLVDALTSDARRAEALRVVQEARAALAEYGLEPGPELLASERRALQSDVDDRNDEDELCEASVRASLSLQRAGAYSEARALLAEAADRAAKHSSRRSTARVKVEQARLSMLSGEGDPGELLAAARSIGRELRDGSLLASAALVGFGAGLSPDKGSALVELLEPLPLLPSGAPEAVDLLCAAAVTVAFADGSPAARQLMDEANHLHARQATPRSEALLAVTQAMVDAVEGRSHEVVTASATRSLDLARAADDHVLVVLASMAALRAAYTVGDLRAVDGILPMLDHSSRVSMLPFGTVRVALCLTANAIGRGELAAAQRGIEAELAVGRRFRTLVTDAAVRSHRFLLAREADTMGELMPVARLARAGRPVPNSWDAVIAAAGDLETAERLAELAPQVKPDDSFDVLLALGAEVAARRGDAVLGAWCVEHLRSATDRTLMTGIGTIMFGFGAHFLGLAHAATGDLESAQAALLRSVDRAAAVGAELWWAHSQVELAEVEARRLNREEARAALTAAADSPARIESARLARRVAEVTERLALSMQ